MNQICSTISKYNFEVDIIKIIRIILFYDKNRKYQFCCKKHCDFFNKNYSVMEPELSKRLEPISKLLEKIFEKTYKKLVVYNQNINTNNNQIKSNKKNSNKTIKTYEDIKFYESNNFYYLFYLLTYNVSPCVQYMIIELLIKFISNQSFDCFLKTFDSQIQLIYIILFVLKTSIFDVKIFALNLLLIIEKKNNWFYLNNDDIKIFLQNELLPIFLLDEVSGIENKIEVENEEEIKENEIKEEEKKQLDNVLERKQELNVSKSYKYKKSNKYGLMKDIEIDKEKYVLFTPTEMERIICQLFNKKKYKYLVGNLYVKLFEYILETDIIFNLLIKTLCNGDLSLINNFITYIKNIINSPEILASKHLKQQIIYNETFLQFILDVNLQLYIFDKNKDKTKIFIPSFSLDARKNEIISEELEEPLNEEEKKNLIKACLKDCETILIYIFSQNIKQLDYVLSWGKYYDYLKEENTLYNYVYEFINEIFFTLLTNKEKTVVTLNERSNINDKSIQSTLYYFNIFFEFITFFKLKYNDTFFLMNKPEMNKILEENLKLVMHKKESSNIKNLTPMQEMQAIDDKVDNFPFITVVLKILNPIWIGGEKKTLKNENEVYSKHMNSMVNKNIYTNELEILFYKFDEKFFENKDSICNKGLNLITILYHFFTLVLNIGGDKRELSDFFVDFRLYLLLLITAPPSINISESIKKRKWPNEHQNAEIRSTIHFILFDATFFLYSKLQNFKMQEKDYSSKPDDEESKKNLECIIILRRFYMENLGYILKILNKIYRGLKADEISNKGFKLFGNKNKIIERIRNSGAYSFINELYEE